MALSVTQRIRGMKPSLVRLEGRELFVGMDIAPLPYDEYPPAVRAEALSSPPLMDGGRMFTKRWWTNG